MRVQLLLLLVTGTALSACTPKKIPGTDIDDTEDTQAVLAVVRKYRAAVEARNVEGIYQLCDKSFSDDGGTAVPDDDLEYDTLKAKLTERMAHVADLKLDLTVRRIEFDTEENYVRVTFSYNVSFKMPGYTSHTHGENDIKQMMLKRIDKSEWKITSGI